MRAIGSQGGPGPGADLAAAMSQRRGLAARRHRPWTPAPRPWLMGQSWYDLLFAHWRVDPEALRRVVPPQLPLDLIDGDAWVGVTPFQVRALRLRHAPPLPFVSTFCELNVRTYVTVDDRPGIYFLSLDAAQRNAVIAARRSYRLPYFHARMSIVRGERGVSYRSERTSADGPPARFAGDYAPAGPASIAAPGSLDHALVERYCAYTLDAERRPQRIEIHHPPWRVRPASAEIETSTMAAPQGISLESEPLLHLAEPQHVLIWAPRPAD